MPVKPFLILHDEDEEVRVVSVSSVSSVGSRRLELSKYKKHILSGMSTVFTVIQHMEILKSKVFQE